MEATVFYSWQSDLPNPTNRTFIQTALEKAAKRLRNDNSLTVEPRIDRDTEGEPGSPDIGITIFEKIERAAVFVCDVSMIGVVENDEKKRFVPNPNVLVELGYALKALGHKRVIMVMNTAFGNPENLPFDLNKKKVMAYSMPREVEDKASVRKQLEDAFVRELSKVFANIPAEPLVEEKTWLNYTNSARQIK